MPIVSIKLTLAIRFDTIYVFLEIIQLPSIITSIKPDVIRSGKGI
jgi:hypothetical protein